MASVGDAVASFLQRPDPNTKGKCLINAKTTSSEPSGSAHRHDVDTASKLQPLKWDRAMDRKKRWHHGATWKQVVLGIVPWLACLASSLYSMLHSRFGSAVDYSVEDGEVRTFESYLGTPSLFRGGSTHSIIAASVLVNLPQLLLSALYFSQNTIYTCMASAYEWSQFAHTRKSLRVTARKGQQRPSYWLQLPWKVSLPLLAVSTLLHWLISQSIFLVNVAVGDDSYGDKQYVDVKASLSDNVRIAIGYAPFAAISAIVVAGVVLIALLIVCFLPLKPGMPLVGSNSFAISAACHPPKVDKNAAFKPVMWGAVSHQDGDGPGHCCFTSYKVEPPRLGEYYAGL